MAEYEYETKPLVDEESGMVFWPDNPEDEKFFREVEGARDLREGEEVDPHRFWQLKK